MTTNFSEVTKQQYLQKALWNKTLMAFFSDGSFNYLWKMRGYPQFSFSTPVPITKICFSRTLLDRDPIFFYYKEVLCFSDHNAQNVCALTKEFTIKRSCHLLQKPNDYFLIVFISFGRSLGKRKAYQSTVRLATPVINAVISFHKSQREV